MSTNLKTPIFVYSIISTANLSTESVADQCAPTLPTSDLLRGGATGSSCEEQRVVACPGLQPVPRPRTVCRDGCEALDVRRAACCGVPRSPTLPRPRTVCSDSARRSPLEEQRVVACPGLQPCRDRGPSAATVRETLDVRRTACCGVPRSPSLPRPRTVCRDGARDARR